MEQDAFLSEVTRQLTALVQSGALQGWSLKASVSRSHQRLYASPDGATLTCHQSRRVNGDAYKLSVYSSSTKTDRIGMALIDLVPFRPIDKQLKEAIALSHGSQNQAWKLAGPTSIPPAPVETCDPAIRDTPEKVMASIEQQFTTALAATADCRLNSAELFLNYHTSSLINSEGLSYVEEQSDIYLEAALEKADGENDKEVHEHATAVAAKDLDVKTFIDQCALQVSVLGDSEEPRTTDSVSILITKDALSQMLEAVLMQLNCTNEYLKLPFLQPGDHFGGGNGDALTLSLDPTLPCMALSSAYAIDGVPARAGALVKTNHVVDRVVGNRFGQYLGLEPNGLSGNLVVEAGSLTKDSLTGIEYIEVIKFSSLLIDAQKLTWSSEIKLGRHISADGRSTLIKGGVVSGNLKENFTDCRFSATLGSSSVPPSSYTPALGYRGPDAMFITRGVSIAGQSQGDS